MSIIDDPAPPARHDLHRFWLPPARAFPFLTVLAGVQTLVQGAGLWFGHATEETTGAAAARLVVMDGQGSVAGQTIAPLTFAAGESRLDQLGEKGVLFTNGLQVAASTGTVSGSLWAVLLTRDELALLLRERTGNRR